MIFFCLLFFHQGKKRRSQKASSPRHVFRSTPIDHKKKRLLPVGCRGATAYAPLTIPKRPFCTYPDRPIRPQCGRSEGVFNTPLPYRQERAILSVIRLGIHTFFTFSIQVRISKSMPSANLSPTRFGHILYPANFPGLGRGLDLLLPSFLPSREEKKNPESKYSSTRLPVHPNQP